MGNHGGARAADKASAPEGAQALPSDLAPVIEDSIRSYFAKPIENYIWYAISLNPNSLAGFPNPHLGCCS